MQTFLPYHNIKQSIHVLDRQRLGKQRVEALQILHNLLGISSGWRNHPAVKMWKGYEACLVDYTLECCRRWHEDFRYVDNVAAQVRLLEPLTVLTKHELPDYFTDEFHLSHQSNLIRKDRIYVPVFGMHIPNDLPYIWPVERVIYLPDDVNSHLLTLMEN